MADFKRLKVWEAGHRVSVDVYALVKTLPRDELYGLRSQMTRAAGSATELERHVLRARDLNFVAPGPAEIFLRQVDEVQKMLVGLRRRVRQRRAR